MSVVSGLLRDVLIGLLSAGFVGSVLYSKNYLSAKYQEYKYPVSGEYITEYTDEVNGTEVEVKAPAVVEQKGRSIEGYTALPGTNRGWRLEGEIYPGGFVNGVYHASDPHDQGIGNFFLHVEHDRVMEGIWSGYDEVNEKINFGDYRFIPVFDAFEIRPLESAQIPTAVHLGDAVLGKNYLSGDVLRRSLADDSPYFTRVAVTTGSDDESLPTRVLDRVFGPAALGWRSMEGAGTDPGEVVGFCLGGVVGWDEFESYLLVEVDDLPEGLKEAERIGVIRTAAVQDDHQGVGIGTDLVGDCMDECLERGCEVVVGVGWKASESANVEGIMDRFGFDGVVTFEQYWHDDSVAQGYECTSCGEPPCECDAVLYTKYD